MTEMTEPYAKVVQTWIGGPSSFSSPIDMQVMPLSKKKLIEYGGADFEKLNFTVEYDVTKLNYAANISIGLFFDKSVKVGQTDLKSVQGVGRHSYRMPFLPEYDSQKTLGPHRLDIVIKLRPRWTIWHLVKNFKDFMELRSVAESMTTRSIILNP